jgi:hypothetical protein
MSTKHRKREATWEVKVKKPGKSLEQEMSRATCLTKTQSKTSPQLQGTIRLGRLIYVFEPTFDYSAHLLYACALYLRRLWPT